MFDRFHPSTCVGEFSLEVLCPHDENSRPSLYVNFRGVMSVSVVTCYVLGITVM